MPDSFGNSLLGIALLVILMWAWFEPKEAGQWLNEFQHGRNGSVATE